MSCSSELKGFKSSDDPNVIQLGLNISVIGKSASDVEVYVNDRKEPCGQISIPHLEHVTDQGGASHSGSGGEAIKRPGLDKVLELKDMELENRENEKYSSSTASDEPKDKRMSKGEDLTIVEEIKSAMGNFEKFSEHLREIPRLSTKRIYTSTPYPDKTNSRSEGNLSCLEHPPRPFIRKHDFRDRKYFRKAKPLPGDLFLKPLPAEDYFKKTYVRRYYDVESYHHYSSVDNLPQYYENDGDYRTTGKYLAKSDVDKSDGLSSNSDVCVTDVKSSKKGGSDVNDKQSTSSESTKDIKIYQSGGIIIMQNFSENTDVTDKKDRMVEHCNKLAGKVETSLPSSDDSQRLLLNSSSDEVKGKFVQFDLSSSGNAKWKSSDPSSDIPEHDYGKTLGNLLPAHPNQDLTSLSTQENDSVISNLLGMSPTSSTSGKKLEWDSGADVGYLNMDLTTENISTIERIILKGLTNDGTSEKQVVYQRTEGETGSRQTKFILERLPSDLEMKGASGANSTPAKNELDQNVSVNTKSSSGSSQSGEGPSCIPKKRQSADGKNESREKFQSPVKSRTNKTKYHTKVQKSEDDCKDKKTSEPDTFLEPGKRADASRGVKSWDAKEELAHTECVVQEEPSPNYVDKSTYVNTLFPEPCFELPLDNISKSEESGRSESSDRNKIYQAESPRTKKLKKKKNSIQETNLTSRLKDKIDTIIDIARHSRTESSGRPDSGTPEPSDKMELLRKLEELEGGNKKNVKPTVVKSDPTSLVSVHKSTNLIPKEKLSRSRPVPTSSGSTRSDKLNSDSTRDSAVVLDNVKSFSDQIVQTSELRCESKAIQAFQSAKCSAESSQVDEKSARKSDEIPPDDNAVSRVDSSNLLSFCSKSIQAPGMNSSLPKHLAHPKQISLFEHLNTKSTQFFGGSRTSLPNYHVSAIGKEAKKGKILKNKLLPDDENSRIQMENVKNALRNENSKKELTIEDAVDRTSNPKADECSDTKSTKKTSGGMKKGKNDSENKENFSVNEEELTDNSKRPSSHSRVESKESYNPGNGSKKSDSLNFGSCEVQFSDDGRNVFLTSERLKEHGDTIDRNIIQEKYFQSQLLELGVRHMISRGTSIEKKRDAEKNIQTSFSLRAGVSVSCQYSPTLMSRGEDVQRYPQVGNGLKEEIQPENPEQEREKCEAKAKKMDENSFNTVESSPGEAIYATGDTLSNSSRSVHSWIPGEQKSSGNRVTVDRALSFEYLPGHIYENVEDLAQESPNETERNLKLELNETDSTPTSGAQVKESESGHTLVLENSPVVDSDQLKNLDTNLTELEMVVNRLHEKEALFQRITDSVLSSVSQVRGSGDSTIPSGDGKDLSNNTSQGAEEIKSEFVVPEGNGKLNGSKPGTSEKNVCTKDVSTACQTEDVETDSGCFREERKKLERKMNDEKEQQIKWIENEINHLNMLRSLLEKQDDLSSTNRKKRHYYLTETKEGLIPSVADLLGQEIFKNVLAESLPRSLPSVSQDQSETKISPPLKLTDDSASESKEVPNNAKHFAQFGMALSLTRANAMREITMLPVGIQVTLRGKKSGSRDGTLQERKSDSVDSKQRRSQSHSSQDIVRQADVGVQHPSVGNRLPGSSSTFESIDSSRRCRCFKCEKTKCACSSDSTGRRKSLQSSSKKGSVPKEESGEVFGQSSTIVSGESPKLDVKIPEIRDMDDSRGVSTIGTPSPEIRSRESSKQEQSRISSEGSTPFGKCVCCCHAKPLPRCQNCNLLNTCKKCKCYKRITCCVCKGPPSESSPRRKCATISSTCFYKKDFCQMCQCSRKKNQLCSLCPCHVTLEKPQSRCKKYEERSCQTEGRKCTCCECDEKGKQDSGIYRETKYMTEEQHSSENRKSSDVVYLSEQRYEQERKAPVEEKFPYQIKVPIERKAPAEVKNAGQRRNEIENRTPSQLQALEIKELKKKAQCRCRSSDARRKSSEDHPRHYFLQVEDTTEEESSESCDNRNSLEVITIKVPIRKVFKGNRNACSPQRNGYQKKSVQSNDLYVGDTRYVEENVRGGKECNCFENCERYSYKHFVERPRIRGDSRAYRTQLGDAQRQFMYEEPPVCKCCEDCPGHAKSEGQDYEEYPVRDGYKRQISNVVPYEVPTKDENLCNCTNCMQENNYKPLVYSPKQHGYEEEEIPYSGECHCCSDCPGKMQGDLELKPSELPKPGVFSGYLGGYEGENLSGATDFTGTKSREKSPTDQTDLTDVSEEKREKSSKGKSKTGKSSNESSPKLSRKSPRRMKSCRAHTSPKSKAGKGGTRDGSRDKNADYYNFNKKEFLTKSELEREGKKKAPTRLSLQECLTVKRPDLYTRAECRRKIISEKTRDRVERHNKRMECLTKLMPQCDVPGKHGELKLFTSAEMRKQTRKHYKNLPEVTNKAAEEKKKIQFRTNKLMAEIFAKKLQLQTLKGRLNLSNSFTVMSTM